MTRQNKFLVPKVLPYLLPLVPLLTERNRKPASKGGGFVYSFSSQIRSQNRAGKVDLELRGNKLCKEQTNLYMHFAIGLCGFSALCRSM